MARIAIIFEDREDGDDLFSLTTEGDLGDDPEYRTMSQWLARMTIHKVEELIQLMVENGALYLSDEDENPDEEVDED